ncbi:hypothetical protein D3H64_08040 [Atopobacter sp. AH10]|uniref:hypothetical protein n=1 Tax=Atopobacter sp. AH10 TaxID=2315861 RepID=UPI000EF1EAAE|nr:hypothetical protein [Atopobacter sp. AH10]RLK62736.1 hypothetical protein D3H64_08040 [Atopobacter sp. AH10]
MLTVLTALMFSIMSFTVFRQLSSAMQVLIRQPLLTWQNIANIAFSFFTILLAFLTQDTLGWLGALTWLMIGLYRICFIFSTGLTDQACLYFSENDWRSLSNHKLVYTDLLGVNILPGRQQEDIRVVFMQTNSKVTLIFKKKDKEQIIHLLKDKLPIADSTRHSK